jgi:hypothetical protein
VEEKERRNTKDALKLCCGESKTEDTEADHEN